jgi:hypothetical protein
MRRAPGAPFVALSIIAADWPAAKLTAITDRHEGAIRDGMTPSCRRVIFGRGEER